MNTCSNNQSRSRRGAKVAATFALLAVAGGGAGAGAGETPELQTHWLRVPGVRHIEAGDYQRGVVQLEERLAKNPRASSLRVPILIDLCVGYAMLGRTAEALRHCNAAIAARWPRGALEARWARNLARNNRGVIYLMQGHYEMAVRDLGDTVRSDPSYRTAKINLAHGEARLAALRAPRPAALAGGAQAEVETRAAVDGAR